MQQGGNYKGLGHLWDEAQWKELGFEIIRTGFPHGGAEHWLCSSDSASVRPGICADNSVRHVCDNPVPNTESIQWLFTFFFQTIWKIIL